MNPKMAHRSEQNPAFFKKLNSYDTLNVLRVCARVVDKDMLLERKVLSVPAGTSGPNLSSGTQLAATLLVCFGHTLQKLFKPALLFALFQFC